MKRKGPFQVDLLVPDTVTADGLVCKFCQQATEESDLRCDCCDKDLPCLTFKDTHHKDQDYGGNFNGDRGEWNDAGYMCNYHSARICPECAVDCVSCDMWLCKECKRTEEDAIVYDGVFKMYQCADCFENGVNEN